MSKREGPGGSGRPATALGAGQARRNDRREEPCAELHS
jgi:hypothetical protein